MRYYKITLTTQDGKPISIASLRGAGLPPGVISSLDPSGRPNMAALNVEFDLNAVAGYMTNGAHVRIWGLSLIELNQAFKLAGAAIKIEGGMSKGLPLAEPTQAGLLVQSSIFQSFGNWEGTSQTLDLFLAPVAGSLPEPLNIIFNWAKGQQLGEAIKNALISALGSNNKVEIVVNVSDQRVGRQTQAAGQYKSFQQFAQFILNMTQKQLSPDDAGVTLASNQDNLIRVFDTSPSTGGKSSIKEIRYQDLIGQPVWIAPSQMQAKLVMRGDLSINQTIRFSTPINILSSYGAFPSSTQGAIPSATIQNGGQLTFQGEFNIVTMRHYGNFRSPDPSAWVTVINCNRTVPGQNAGNAPANTPAR